MAGSPADYMPLVGAAVGAVCAAIAGIAAALITSRGNLRAKQARTAADETAQATLEEEVNERLLARFERELQKRDEKIEDLTKGLADLAKQVDGLRLERNQLIDFIYALIRIIREKGSIDLIPEPPHGIYITGRGMPKEGTP